MLFPRSNNLWVLWCPLIIGSCYYHKLERLLFMHFILNFISSFSSPRSDTMWKAGAAEKEKRTPSQFVYIIMWREGNKFLTKNNKCLFMSDCTNGHVLENLIISQSTWMRLTTLTSLCYTHPPRPLFLLVSPHTHTDLPSLSLYCTHPPSLYLLHTGREWIF